MPSIYERLTIPEARRATSISQELGEFIFEFLRSQPICKTLETGFAYGCSTAHIMSATGAPHIAIDAYQHGYDDLGLANIARLGLQDRLRFIRAPSHVALPQLLAAGEAIDFAFIDGGHKFDEMFVDWFYIGHLLNQGGHVMFDDAWLEATQMVAAFLRRNRKDFQEIKVPVGNVVMFRRVGRDESDWRHFQPFGPDREPH